MHLWSVSSGGVWWDRRNTKLQFPVCLTLSGRGNVVGNRSWREVPTGFLAWSWGITLSIKTKEFSWSGNLGWFLRARLVEICTILSWTPSSIPSILKPSLRCWGLVTPTVINPKTQIPRFPLWPEVPSPQLCGLYFNLLKVLMGRAFCLSAAVRAGEGRCASPVHWWSYNYARKACPLKTQDVFNSLIPVPFLLHFLLLTDG